MLDTSVIRRNFNRAADSYDEAAILPREVADRLVERLPFIHIEPTCIVECGARTGYLSQALSRYYPDADVIALDCAEQMLFKNPCASVASHTESLPFKEASVDMIVSSLALNGTNDPAACFREFRRVLKPNGLVMITMLGVETLKELRASFACCQPYHQLFPDMHDIGDLLLQAGFEDPVMDMEAITFRYRRLTTLFSDLKKTGAINAHVERPKGLFGRERWRHAIEQYHQRRDEEAFPATFEIIYGHAWLPLDTQDAETVEVQVPVESLY